MSRLRRLLGLLPDGERRRFARLVAALSLASLLEAAGIGLVLPYLRAITRTEEAFAHPWAGPVLEALGVGTGTGLVLAASAALVGFFLLKNGYVGLVWHRIYGFLHGNFLALSERLLRGYLRAPYTFHLQRNTATLIRNATVETERLFRGNGAVKPALALLSELLVAAGLLAVLVWVHPTAALTVLALLVALGWGLSSLVRQKVEDLGRERSRRQGEALQAVQEGLGGVKELRLLGREDHFADRFRAQAAPLAEAMRRNSLIELLPRLTLETGSVLALAAVASFLALSSGDLQEALPVVGVFTVAIVRLMPSVRRVVHDLNCVRFHLAAVETVHDELELLAPWIEAADRPPAEPLRLREALEARELSYVYPDAEEPAVRSVSFTAAAGDAIGLVGPSGSGKTTLANLLLGLLEPTAGRILVDGTDVAGRTAAWQRSLGYIPQEAFLADDTLRRNVAFGMPDAEIDDGRVWTVLEAAELAPFVRRQPDGLGTRIGERGERISAGQRQRVAIARALYHDPEVLVLDEPTSALDYETEHRIAETVMSLAGRKTLVIVTHRLETVRGCDTIHLMEEGRLSASGTFDELRERSEGFRRLWRRGLREAGADPAEAVEVG